MQNKLLIIKPLKTNLTSSIEESPHLVYQPESFHINATSSQCGVPNADKLDISKNYSRKFILPPSGTIEQALIFFDYFNI